ncbi:MAG TPA: oxygenase MpaB family protein [Angustibacter sp.]|nr:oxygenase MpaB family protein [Angustibacter sp.]
MTSERHDDGLSVGEPDDSAGLFGPSTQTWRLHSEPLLGLAILRGLLLGALHPANPAASDDVWLRLSRAVEVVGAITFGTPGQALAVAARERIEQSMRGLDDLAAWHHCCQVDSVVEVLRRSGVALDDEQADRYVAEQVSSATLLGLEPDEVPTDLVGVQDVLREMRPDLGASTDARADIGEVVAPSVLVDRIPVPRPPWAAVAGLAYAALPSWARRLYAMPGLPGAAALHGAATTVALHTLRSSLRGTPGVPEVAPTPHVRTARERLAAPPES